MEPSLLERANAEIDEYPVLWQGRQVFNLVLLNLLPNIAYVGITALLVYYLVQWQSWLALPFFWPFVISRCFSAFRWITSAMVWIMNYHTKDDELLMYAPSFGLRNIPRFRIRVDVFDMNWIRGAWAIRTLDEGVSAAIVFLLFARIYMNH